MVKTKPNIASPDFWKKNSQRKKSGSSTIITSTDISKGVWKKAKKKPQKVTFDKILAALLSIRASVKKPKAK